MVISNNYIKKIRNTAKKKFFICEALQTLAIESFLGLMNLLENPLAISYN